MTEKIKKFIEEFKKLENRETIKINLISETKTPLTSSNVAGWRAADVLGADKLRGVT